MTKKFDNFMECLELLCRQHEVQIAVSMYDSLQIWDLEEGEDVIYAPDIEDFTEETK